MRHIRNRRDTNGLAFYRCAHKPTRQWYSIALEGGSVETLHGTMTFRAGDHILQGADGETLYVITAKAFVDAYDVSPYHVPQPLRAGSGRPYDGSAGEGESGDDPVST